MNGSAMTYIRRLVQRAREYLEQHQVINIEFENGERGQLEESDKKDIIEALKQFEREITEQENETLSEVRRL